MVFHFLGETRLRMFFETPNQCGAALGMLACLLCGAAVLSWPPSHALRCPHWLAVAGIGVLFVAIALTYSRGAYLAVAGSLLGLALIDRVGRRGFLWALAAFWLCVAVVPAGPSRVATIVTPMADRSIANRLELWRAALVMAWDHFPAGAGPEGFRQDHGAWYQAPDRHAVYVTGVSDYATLVGGWGIPAASCYLGVVAALVWQAARALRNSRSPRLGAALGVLLCYLLAAGASTFIHSKWLYGPFLIALVVATWETVRMSPHIGSAMRSLLARSFALAGAGVALLSAVAAAGAGDFPVRPVPTENFGVAPRPQLQAVEPRTHPVQGSILVISDRWFPEQEARWLVRPLAEGGYNVVLFAPSDHLETGRRECERLLAELLAGPWKSRPCFLAGYGEGGRLALIIAAKDAPPGLSGVVSVASDPSHPMPVHSPETYLTPAAPPILLLQDPEDRQHNPAGATRLAGLARAAGTNVTLVPVALGSDEFRKRWAAVRAPLLSFLHNPKPR